MAESGEPLRPLSKHILTDNPYVKSHTVHDLWHWTGKRDAYRAEYAAHWNSTATSTDSETGLPSGAVDVILCPVGPGAAPLLDTAKYWGYTSQWNVLDYPAVVFPVTSVKPDVDVKEANYKPKNEEDKFNYELYEAEKYKDAPVCLQLVARRYEDEKLIGALESIQGFIGKSEFEEAVLKFTDPALFK
jgi:amidase